MIYKVGSMNSVIKVQLNLDSEKGGNSGYQEQSESFKEVIKEKKQNKVKPRRYLPTLSPMELYNMSKAKAHGIDVSTPMMAEKISVNQLAEIIDRIPADLKCQDDTAASEVVKKTVIFPPQNAPDKVKLAWEKTTSKMSYKEKMLATFPFMAAQAEANIKQLPNGQVKVISPGEEDYKEIFSGEPQDYIKLIDHIITKLKVSTVEQREKDKLEFKLKVLTELRKGIEKELLDETTEISVRREA
jgi:hypothetical protein